MNIFNIIEKELNEVRYLNTKAINIPKEKPIKDNETIRVYHGFYSYDDVLEVVSKGLSGREKASRVYSYEYGNNPYGLFVTTDFNVAVKFASSGVIIEFTAKVSDLEAPVWSGGGGYFVQGQKTTSFKPDTDEREQQRLSDREVASKSKYDSISKSDRPELADTLFDNSERQALFVGDLNPNMIKRVWYNEKRRKEKKTDAVWEKYSPKDFVNKFNINKKGSKYKIFKANDDFDLNKYKEVMSVEDDKDLKFIIQHMLRDIDSDYYLKQTFGLFPKQINQIRNLYNKGYFNKYLEESLHESINPNSAYKFDIFKKNNKIGFYTFKNIEGIEYEVRISKYIDDINGIDSNILDIEFSADNNWKQTSNIKDQFKVFSTIGAILKDYYTKDIDYITYILDRNDNPEKRNKIYQYIVKNIGLNISDVIKIGSNIYLKIIKKTSLIERIIKEELTNIPPNQYNDEMVVDDIVNYLYNNQKYNIKRGKIIDYKDRDTNKIKEIKIFGKDNGPYPDNKFYIYPYISFNIISNDNGYNVDNIEITGDENGFFKDLKNGEGYNIKLMNNFSGNFYKLLKKEIINNFRFDNENKFNPNSIPSSKNIKNPDNDVVRLEPNYITYIESLAKMDSSENRRKRILKLTEKVKKQNYYTKKSLYNLFESYKKGNLK